MTNINRTLEQRGSKYGTMPCNANLTRKLMATLEEHSGYAELSNVHVECLQMIMHKISRLMCGNPYYADNVHDIAGYATLLEEFIIDQVDQAEFEQVLNNG